MWKVFLQIDQRINFTYGVSSTSSRLYTLAILTIHWPRDNGTIELDPDDPVRGRSEYHERQYQSESLRQEVHLVPIDDVSIDLRLTLAPSVLTRHRKKSTDSKSNTGS